MGHGERKVRMMYKLYDYSCLNKECDDYQKIIEVLASDGEVVGCQKCTNPMEVALTYGSGRVQQGTPKFHRNSKSK